jgi:apolipoprotein N-acyltransferase
MQTLAARAARLFVQTGAFFNRLSGWRRLAASFAAGMLSALAFAPFGLCPLLLLSYGALVLMLDATRKERRPLRAATATGWAFGFGQFLIGLYWVGYAFTVDADAHAWQIPFVELLLPGGLALFPALACAVAAPLWRPGLSRIFVLTIALAASEWLRGHLFTGFPWNLAGYGWGASLAILQSAAWSGVYGLTLLTILFGASLAALCSRDRGQVILPLSMLIVFALLWTGGVIRLAAPEPPDVPNVRLRIVQPNIPEKEKFNSQYIMRNWRRLTTLSAQPSGLPPTHIIWPESAPPFLLSNASVALEEIARLTGQNKTLLTGAARFTETQSGERRFYNSFYVFGPRGQTLGVYDKFHLVPFGEYLPLAGVFHSMGIDSLVNSPGVFSSGDGPHTLPLPGAPAVGPLICYEVIFPDEVVGRTRPGWLVNVTNDSWFGMGAGPHQHLLIARVRAIEEGLPLARAADTGISAVFDSNGRLRAMLGLQRTGILDTGLPGALPPTIYAQSGHLGFFAMLCVCICVAFSLWQCDRNLSRNRVS